jgi:preprotein translocase subunit SecG
MAMHRRTVLLFILFLALAAFYAMVMRESSQLLSNRQKQLTETLNQLDEQVLGPAGRADDTEQE